MLGIAVVAIVITVMIMFLKVLNVLYAHLGEEYSDKILNYKL
jgi:hypothetical protein